MTHPVSASFSVKKALLRCSPRTWGVCVCGFLLGPLSLPLCNLPCLGWAEWKKYRSPLPPGAQAHWFNLPVTLLGMQGSPCLHQAKLRRTSSQLSLSALPGGNWGWEWVLLILQTSQGQREESCFLGAEWQAAQVLRLSPSPPCLAPG